MKITRVTALVLRLPEVTAACDGTQDTCLIKIETDAGITGWGEVDSAPTVVKAVVEAPLSHQISNGLANALEGADPLAIDACMARMEEAVNYYGRTGAGSHAMAGVNFPEVYKELSIPEHEFEVICAFAIGALDTPDKLPLEDFIEGEVPSGRKPLAEIWHQGRFKT